MKKGYFCYIKDEYFEDFPDANLMKNKETVDSVVHNRPCFYALHDTKFNIYWLIPISSQIQKYKKIYYKNVEKYGFCSTIVFGNVFGMEKAFLIQNMCPITPEYINNLYYDKNGKLVTISKPLEKKLLKLASETLIKLKKGKKIIFPDVLKIEKELKERQKSR